MKATALLEKEHTLISTMLRVLEKVCEKLEAGESVNGEHLDQILEFIGSFADHCHHGKEETLLFPALEEVGLPKEGGPIAMMLQEHDLGRRYISVLRKSVSRYRAGEMGATESMIENAGLYIALLTQHIDKENHILFKIADLHLSAEKQDELCRAFLKVDKEVLGNEKRKTFLELVNHLSQIYLDETRKVLQADVS